MLLVCLWQKQEKNLNINEVIMKKILFLITLAINVGLIAMQPEKGKEKQEQGQVEQNAQQPASHVTATARGSIIVIPAGADHPIKIHRSRKKGLKKKRSSSAGDLKALVESSNPNSPKSADANLRMPTSTKSAGASPINPIFQKSADSSSDVSPKVLVRALTLNHNGVGRGTVERFAREARLTIAERQAIEISENNGCAVFESQEADAEFVKYTTKKELKPYCTIMELEKSGSKQTIYILKDLSFPPFDSFPKGLKLLIISYAISQDAKMPEILDQAPKDAQSILPNTFESPSLVTRSLSLVVDKNGHKKDGKMQSAKDRFLALLNRNKKNKN
jgi:hypothetical protein